jgi:hypothetical protein
MSRIVAAILIVLALFVIVGLIIPAIFYSRNDAEMRRCQNNLRQIGGIGVFHSYLPNQPPPRKAQSYFPEGTVVVANLAPERRMSWHALVLGSIEQGPSEPGNAPSNPSHAIELLREVDVQKPWDAEANQRLARQRFNVFLCPAASTPVIPDQPAPTNYVGNGGIGFETAALSIEQSGARAGVFRYDSRTPLDVIRDGDGLSNTISILETNYDAGPWLRGGFSTVRSLDRAEPPFLGPHMPFSGCHLGKGNFAIADGSVRTLTDTIAPELFRALLTIQGNETDFVER